MSGAFVSRTCYTQDSIVWPLPPGKVRDNVITSQPLHLFRPRRASKDAVDTIQQPAQLALGYGCWVVPQVIHHIQHLHASHIITPDCDLAQ